MQYLFEKSGFITADLLIRGAELRFFSCEDANACQYGTFQPAFPRKGNIQMFSRIRSPRGRPSIRRPRAVAATLAVALALTTSSAFAQRGGGRCAGMSGGTGVTGGTSGSTSGGFGGAGGMGGVGSGQLNSMAMASSTQFAQPMQGMEGMFIIPSVVDEVDLGGNHQQQLAARKAIRAAQLEERRAEREAFRPEKKSRVVATRARPPASR